MITICSVTDGYNQYLNLNYQLTREINKEKDFKWIVALNTQQNDSVVEKPPLEGNFITCPGKRFSQAETIAENMVPGGGEKSIRPASMHHSLGLNECLKLVDTRFALFLDPDFYIVPSLKLIMDLMLRKKLTMFGASYCTTTKVVKDFPMASCLFIDSDTLDVDLQSLDFLASFGSEANDQYYPDAGYKIYNKYKNSGIIKYDFMVPGKDFGKDCKVTHKTIKGLYDISFNRTGRQKPYPDQYFYDNKLFGVHVRAKMHQPRSRIPVMVSKRIKTVQEVIRKVREHESWS
jgi:hypothetical protein